MIWDPRDLPRVGTWQDGGPRLPIEFSRVSRDCRLTLVVDDENGEMVETKYVLSPRTDLGEAIEDLRMREGTVQRQIGFVDAKHNGDSGQKYVDHRNACGAVRTWLNDGTFEAAVWTALPSNFMQETGQAFSIDRAVEYLERLPKSAKLRAFHYIRSGPPETQTPLRRHLVERGLMDE